MSVFVVVIILISTFAHAGWNLLARNQRDDESFFSRMLLIIVAVGFLPAVSSEILVRSITLKAWLCVLGSGLFCGFYYFYLARSYKSLDFTTVYPIVRSLPILLIALGDVLRGRYPTPIGWLGMLLVTSGCFFAPLNSIRDFAIIRKYFNKKILWMSFAAVGTVGYTLLDKIASEVVKRGPATAARYGYMFFLISWLSYNMFHSIFKEEKESLDLIGWKIPFFASLLNFGAYWLVLWAFQLTRYASYITAFRQFSIVIGVILAFTIYKEKGLFVRLTGTFLITSGLVLIVLWGS